MGYEWLRLPVGARALALALELAFLVYADLKLAARNLQITPDKWLKQEKTTENRRVFCGGVKPHDVDCRGISVWAWRTKSTGRVTQ